MSAPKTRHEIPMGAINARISALMEQFQGTLAKPTFVELFAQYGAGLAHAESMRCALRTVCGVDDAAIDEFRGLVEEANAVANKAARADFEKTRGHA